MNNHGDLKRFKITVLRIYSKEGLSHEEIAKSLFTFYENEDQARHRAIEEAANTFTLMMDLHRKKGMTGVRFVVTEVPE